MCFITLPGASVVTLSACSVGSLSLWEKNGLLYEWSVFMREQGSILILVADAQNLQRVFLALCVLGENRCIQRSIKVVVHGRDVNPVPKKILALHKTDNMDTLNIIVVYSILIVFYKRH